MVSDASCLAKGFLLTDIGRLGELVGKGENSEREDLAQWLETGNVLYKSVGLGLMDLSVGMHLIEFAKEKGVGTFVQGF